MGTVQRQQFETNLKWHYLDVSTSWAPKYFFFHCRTCDQFAELLGCQSHPDMLELAFRTPACRRVQGFGGPLGPASPGAVSQLLEGCQLAGLLMSGVVSGK